MSIFEESWQEPTRVRMTIMLPDVLADDVADYAADQNSSPMAVIADSVAAYLRSGKASGITMGARPTMERTIALPETVYEALDKRASELHVNASTIVTSAVSAQLGSALYGRFAVPGDPTD